MPNLSDPAVRQPGAVEAAVPGNATADTLPAQTLSRVFWRLIPFLCLLYVFNYLDRVNVAFAKLQMNKDLGFSETVYGLGTSIFFIGYFFFEVPSNLIMQRVGARFWIARIMVSWGLISCAMMFVRSETSFYVLRFLLGVAEAGFFPGVILYMTWWVPAKQRGQAAALFLTSTAISGLIGGPLAGQLLKIEGWGLRGWQWLFLLEGIPSVLLGLFVLYYLDDRPINAKWLKEPQRRWLQSTLDAERAAAPEGAHRLSSALADGRVWVLCLLYGMIMYGFYGVNFWTASIVKSVTGAADDVVGWLSAIPFLAAILAMIFVGKAADLRSSRRKTVSLCCLIGVVGMAGAAFATQPLLSIASLSLAAAGIWSTLGPFWALPSRILAGSAAAAGIGTINSVGNLFGGFIGPNVMGYFKDHYGSYAIGLWSCAGALAVGAGLAVTLISMGLREDDA